MPSSGVSKIMKVAVLAVRSWPSSFSSITTSATQPLGRQRTKPARPTSTLSSFRPRLIFFGHRAGDPLPIVKTRGETLLRGAGNDARLYAMNYQQIISIEPGKRGGRPCIRHMRIAVADVLGWLAVGRTHQEILGDFPALTEDDIRACLAYAAD